MKNYNHKIFIDSAPFAYISYQILIKEDQSDKILIFKDFNKEFIKMTGMTKEELIDKSLSDILTAFPKNAFDWEGFLNFLCHKCTKKNLIYLDKGSNKRYNVYSKCYSKKHFKTIFWEIPEENYEIEMFKNILEKCSEGVVVLKESKIFYSNLKSKNILDIKDTNFMWEHYKNIRNKNDIKKIEKNYEKCLKGKKTEPFAIRALNVDFEEIWFEITFKLISIKTQEFILIFIKNINREKELEKEININKKVFEKGPIISLTKVYNKNNKIIDASDNTENIMGYEKSEILMENFNSLIYHEDFDNFNEKLKNAIDKKQKYFNLSYRLQLKDNKYHWFYEFGAIFENNKNTEIRSYIFDQTQIKEIEFQLSKERERLDYIIKGTNAGTWEWNIQSGEIVLNKRWAEIIGYSLDEIMPTSIFSWKKYIHPDDYKKSCSLIKKHFLGKIDYYECEIRMKHKNGHWVWVLNRGKVFYWTFDKQPLFMFGTHIDISKRKKTEKKIIEMAIRDPLTNVYNRRYIFEKLKEYKNKLIKNNTDFAISIVDIDFFKNINDKYGHLAGDYILQEFTYFIQKRIRSIDLLGRYGGEEFIIVLHNCTKYEAYKKINSMLNDIRRVSFFYERKKIKFTFSAGISDSNAFDFDRINIEKLIDIADNRLYTAKRNGRNNIVIEG